MNKALLGRLRAALPLIALGAYLLMVLTGLFVPIYTDETGWRFQERAGIDGVDSMFNDLCGVNTLARVPWTIMPVRAFSATVNQALADPLFLRLEGIACALAWVAMVWLLTAKLAHGKEARADLRTMIFALLAMGVLPFILVLSRPEQPVILMLTLAVITALWPAAQPASARMVTLKCLAILLMAMIAESYHLKGIVYSPVFAACLLFCARGRGTLPHRLTALAGLAAVTAYNMIYWVHRFQCSGDPVLAAKLAKENVAVIITGGGSVTSLLKQMLLGANPFNYLRLMVAQNGSSWLPDNMFRIVDDYRFCLLLVLVWLWVLAWSLSDLVRFFARERMKAFAEPKAPIALAILASLAVWGASQIHRNYYETSHYLPMAVVFCALCLTLPARAPAERDRRLAITARLGLAVMLPSALMVTAMSLPPMMEANSRPGYIPGMPISVSVFGYDTVRRDIDAAMERAGMDPKQHYNRLLVDDVTYLALQSNTFPMHWLGIMADWHGQITDPVRYLISRHSDGVVVGCQFLPKRMLDVAARSGEVCAISRKGLEQLAASGPKPLVHDE